MMASSSKVPSRIDAKRKVARCMYQKYSCSSLPLPSFIYCEKHISEDKSVPFRQCSHIFPSTRERCTYVVLNTTGNQLRDHGLCREHFEEAEASRLKPKGKLLPPLPTADTILSGLSHYVKDSPFFKRRERLVGATADELLEQIEKNKNIVVDPFLDLDASELNAKTNETLNYSCDVDSDVEPATTDSVWDNTELDSSDPEDLDREMKDPLRHATVFTDEEMILAARNHAVKIQNLCIQQYRRLLYLLREKRAKYLSELKKEKEIYGPVMKPRHMSMRDKKRFDQLKALAKYQKIGTGPEALLFKKMMERRKAVTPGLFCRSSKNYNKCVFSEGGIRCTLRCIPTTKYCKKHILFDKNQVLFHECGVQKKDHTCREPIVPLPHISCVFHSALPNELLLEKSADFSNEEMKGNEMNQTSATINGSKINLEKETLEMLLDDYSKPEPSSSSTTSNNFSKSHPDVTPSTSEVTPISDDLNLNMTDKLFEDISKSSAPFIDALKNISESMSEPPSQFDSSSSKLSNNEEDLELKSVVNEISNFLEMKET